MQFNCDYRCVHCGHTEPVTVEIEEQVSLPDFYAETALFIRACPKCQRRDWASVTMRLLLVFVLAHTALGILVGLAIGTGWSVRGINFARMMERPIASAVAWAAILALLTFGSLNDWASRSVKVRR